MTKKDMINELVKHKQEMQNDFGWNTTVQTALDEAIEALKQQETEYWIEDWEMGLSECPICHDTYLWEDFKGVGSWHYCPNCGKKLEVKSQ